MIAPPEALRPLRERLHILVKHQQQQPDPKRALAIGELEALIRRLENPNAQRRP